MGFYDFGGFRFGFDVFSKGFGEILDVGFLWYFLFEAF